jgi:hypothetical protein
MPGASQQAICLLAKRPEFLPTHEGEDALDLD